MTEVINIKPMAMRGSFEPVPELVEEIEKLLTLAKTGKLRAIACASAHVPSPNWANSNTPSGPFQITVPAAAMTFGQAASSVVACDVMLVTHGHADHLGERALRDDRVVIEFGQQCVDDSPFLGQCVDY